MKLFVVVPNAFADESFNAVFSTLEKASDFINRIDCDYMVNVFASEVIGDYKYPNELFIIKKYLFILDSDVVGVDIFSDYQNAQDTYLTSKGDIKDTLYSEVECYTPDSK